MATNKEGDTSVYCESDFATREKHPLHCAVREIVQRNYRGGLTFDLGCSDFVTSNLLQQQGIPVIGIDLDFSSLKSARLRKDNINVVQANLEHGLPIAKNTQVDCVIMLDIVEHLNRDQAIQLLAELKTLFPQSVAIVSMPNVALTIPCLFEASSMIARGRRPKTGLFDRTHHILTDIKGHKKLFKESGWQVVEQYSTNHFEGVTGEWKTVQPKPQAGTLAEQVVKKLTMSGMPKLLFPGNLDRQEQIKDRLLTYQGLYVLKTDNI